MTLDGNILGGFFEHVRLKPASISTIQGNPSSFPQLKQVMSIAIKIQEQPVKFYVIVSGYSVIKISFI